MAPVLDADWCRAATAVVTDPRWLGRALESAYASAVTNGVDIHRDYLDAAAADREHAASIAPARCGECPGVSLMDHAGNKHTFVGAERAAAWLLGAGGLRAARFARGQSQVLAAAARGAPHAPPAAVAAVALRAADAARGCQRVWHVAGPVAPGALIIPLTDALSGAVAAPRATDRLNSVFAADAIGFVDDRVVIPAVPLRRDGGLVVGFEAGSPIQPCIARMRGHVEWVTQ